ncbi:MAG: FAD-dependent oxidoreductase, partial [Cyanobacteria bacterium P01_C01_bin.69]
MSHTVVMGASPAGLTTAYELAKQQNVTVLEANNAVGGLFRTETHEGCSIDLVDGGFSTQDESVQRLWDEWVGEESMEVEVRSLIHFHHRLFKYPLSATNAIKHLGPINIALTGASYLRSWIEQQQTTTEEHNSEDWVSKRFGPYFNRLALRPYFEKVWGMPSEQLAPSHAHLVLTSHSGKDNTLVRSLIDAVINRPTKTVTYPATGFGQIWNNCKTSIEQAGSTCKLNTQAIKLEHNNNRITQVIASAGENIQTFPIDHLVSSLSLTELVTYLGAPDKIKNAAQNLHYRHQIQVALVLDVAELFDEQSIYINQPQVLVSRIQNFKNWSAKAVPNSSKTCLGLTYFCDETDVIWEMEPFDLVRLASQELVTLRLIENTSLIESGRVVH